MNLCPRGLRKYEIEKKLRHIIRHGAERVLAESPQCLCDFLPDLVSQQVVDRVYAADVRALTAFDGILCDAHMTARGWQTTRGVGGRRAEIEVAVGRAKRRRGRPREVFLTEQDRDMAGSIIRHVREAGMEHLHERLRYRNVACWQPNDEFQWQPVIPLAALHVPRVQNAIEVLENATQMSDAMFDYRRNGLVKQLLAALADCSVSRFKNPLPETIDQLWGRVERTVPERAKQVVGRVEQAELEKQAREEVAERNPKIVHDKALRNIAAGMVDKVTKERTTPEELKRRFEDA